MEEELLIAFKDSRPDLLMEAQNDRTLHRLETAIVRIAKSLRVPGDEDDDDEGVFFCVFRSDTSMWCLQGVGVVKRCSPYVLFMVLQEGAGITEWYE